MALANNNFRSVIKTFKNNAPTILNYFRRYATNTSAEVFNSKVVIGKNEYSEIGKKRYLKNGNNDAVKTATTVQCYC